jgi:hypothetical protein
MNRRELLASSLAAALSAFTPRLSAMADAGTLQPSVSHSPNSMTVNLDCDPKPLIVALDEASALLESGRLPESLCSEFQALANNPDQIVRIDNNPLSAGAYKVIVRLYPSQRFVELLCAARAFER